jgi:hypothetical protein
MSFGRLSAAAFSGTIDSTVALASLNFDFSLIKVEAPAEYMGLGGSLSAHRNKEAEKGITHITARKLGALFADVAPSAPNLIRAYGLRTSEIAKSSKFNPQASKDDGIFVDHVGADGTTIWAAATSGQAAIAVHLLACLLARMWSGPEATSIWVELVSERKLALVSHLNDGGSINMSSIAASEISLTRDQLARWDASARAWLCTADLAKERAQKQLMLILNNIGTPVDRNTSVYDSVLATWKTAMNVVDNLISGMPQSIRGGAPLLGLSSWHLYPDMLVLGACTKQVQQKDPLIAVGGIATLGLEDKQSTEGGRGIYWNLPLAHLQFYGDPVSVTRTISSHTAKLSIDQFLQVALGSFLNHWVTSYAELDTAAEVLLLMCETLAAENRSNLPWLQVLANPAQVLLASKEQDRRECLQLIKCGCRRYPTFFDDQSNLTEPILGLSEPKTLLALIPNKGKRVEVLRSVAPRLSERPSSTVVRYRVNHEYVEFGESKSEWCYECASVVPFTLPTHETPSALTNRVPKRLRNGDEQPVLSHRRWIELPRHGEAQDRVQEIFASGEKIIHLPAGSLSGKFGPPPDFCWKDAPSHIVKATFPVLKSSFTHIQKKSIGFQFLFGDCDSAALYSYEPIRKDATGLFTLQDIKESFTRKAVDPAALRRHLLKRKGTLRSLQALATVLDIYKFMPEARLDIEAAERPLYLARWFNSVRFDSSRLCVLSRAQTFSCIAMFESGSMNIHLDILSAVMAMSVSNSIYVAAPLLSDPFNNYGQNMVKRVIGNVGKPGIAMLIPPRNPKMRVLDHSSWQCINHNQFDGGQNDCFQNTTLHLSFSDWEMPIDIGTTSGRDSEAFFLEAPISIYDRGIWVADVDIIKSLSDPRLTVIRNLNVCAATHTAYEAGVDFATIDRWEELLERPLEEGIVRAHRNWQARLAAAALSVQRGHRTAVLSNNFCWSCYEKEVADGHHTFDPFDSVKAQRTNMKETDDTDSYNNGDLSDIVDPEQADMEETDDTDSDGENDLSDIIDPEQADVDIIKRILNKDRNQYQSQGSENLNIIYIM